MSKKNLWRRSVIASETGMIEKNRMEKSFAI